MPEKRSEPLVSQAAARIFAVLGQSNTMTEAAAKLSLPLSTVSRTIKHLEQQGRTELIRRSYGKLILTDVGARLLEACLNLLRETDAADDVLTLGNAEPTGMLRVVAPVTFVRFVLSPLLPQFLQQHPQLRMEMEAYSSLGDQEPKIIDDVFIKVHTPADSRRRVKLFPLVRHGLFAASSFLEANGRPAEPSDLRRFECLGFSPDGSHIPWVFERENEVLNVKPPLRASIADPEVLVRLCVKSFGISILPIWIAQRHVEDGALVPLLQDWSIPPITLCALFNARPDNKQSAFLNFLGGILGTDRDPRCQGHDPASCFSPTYRTNVAKSAK